MGSTLIESYQPPDDGAWSVVLGPFIRPPVADDDEANDSRPSEDDG